jgi:hypothetical protein
MDNLIKKKQNKSQSSNKSMSNEKKKTPIFKKDLKKDQT